MEKNQTIGIILLSVMMLGYLWVTKDQHAEMERREEEAKQEQIVKKKEEEQKATEIEQQKDSIALAETPNIAPKEITIENEDLIVVFSNKGGSVKEVSLKKHKSYNSDQPLKLIDEKDNNIDLILESKSEGRVDITDKYFETNAENTVVKTGDSTIISFKKSYGSGKYIEQSYTIKDKGYQIGYDLKLVGLDDIFKAQNIEFVWDHNLKRFERGLKESRQRSTINYYTTSEEVDNIGSGTNEDDKIEEDVKWFSLKQRFFNTGIIANTNAFTNVNFKSKYEEEDTLIVREAYARAFIPVSDMSVSNQSFTYYFGPNDYSIVKKMDHEYDYNVYLGWGPLALINKFLVVPIFNFLRGVLGSYGLIIFLLVVIIKLLLFPIAYKSYLSMAKMRELKPEMDALKEKIGDDQQKMQMESMKLYQETGINPLSGCIPQILQMPILFALFQFFPNSIELRQQSFLWAQDLSTYDAPIILPFEIPFYGAHVSIFTLMMTLSTLAYTYYNNQINTQAQGPMKNIGYIMPVIFMFVLNSFSAGLTFYYFVSNLITISQQLIATKFIDKDKIRKAIEENKRKSAAGEGGKKSGFRKILDEQLKAAQEQRKEMDNNKKNKK